MQIMNFAQGQYIGSELKPVMSLFSSMAAEGWRNLRREELTIAAAYMLRVLSWSTYLCIETFSCGSPNLEGRVGRLPLPFWLKGQGFGFTPKLGGVVGCDGSTSWVVTFTICKR